MKIHFTYVRHGSTLFNRMRRMQGACDSPLSAEGITQAENTASFLRKNHFDHIFCSTSERAWDTAKIIAAYHSCEPVLIKELKEFDFGSLDGELFSEYDHMIQPHRIADDWTDVGGENCELFQIRAQKAFSKILSRCNDEDQVLIVSHGSYLSHLMKIMFEGFDQKEYIERRKKQGLPFVPNCSVCQFEYEDGIYRLIKEPMSYEECRKAQNKKVTLYFVRHGETVFNIQKRMQGYSDSPLSENGIRQAEERRETFRNIHFDHAYVSTTERTRDTAAILLEPHDIKPVYDKRLREVYYGSFEGERYEKYWDQLMPMHLHTDFSSAGGESEEEVYARLQRVLNDITDEAEDGDTVLLVSHGDLYMCMMGLLFGKTHEELYHEAGRNNPVPNLGYAVISYENGIFSLKKGMLEE